MPYDVFISYSNKDKLIADAICAKLEENKIRVWIAPRDVPPGKDYAESIIDAIDGCKAFVLIWSKESNKSGHILNEINRAFNKNTTVIPFRIDNIEPTKSLEYYIGRTHWLDAITPPLEEHINKLIDSMLSILGREKRIDHPQPPGDTRLEEKMGTDLIAQKKVERQAQGETTDKTQIISTPNKVNIGLQLSGVVIILAIIGFLIVNRQQGEIAKSIYITATNQIPSYIPENHGLFDDFSSGLEYGIKWAGPFGDNSQYEIINGELFIKNTSDKSSNYEFHILPTDCEIKSCGFLKAKYKVMEDGIKGWGQVKIQYYASLPKGLWFTECDLGGYLDGNQVEYFCYVQHPDGTPIGIEECRTDPIYFDYETWVTSAIRIDPINANINFYLNDKLIKECLPTDSNNLKKAKYIPSIGLYAAENSHISAYFDDVWISNP